MDAFRGKGDLQSIGVYDYTDRMDELGLIHRHFDHMVAEIKILINENYLKQLHVKEAQIKALETQINPHFLYNTLNTINWRAKLIGEQQISEITEALSNLLRTALKEDSGIHTIEKELALVQSYIVIQQSRFGARLHFHQQVDTQLVNVPIPKMTSQPLVENAIKYSVEVNMDESNFGTCQNGIDAYHMIVDECPDIVMTDIKMPGLTGLELIEKIAAMDKEVEIIILSGFGEFEYAKKAMQYGVRHYLLKPCNETQIIEVLETVKKDSYKKRTSFQGEYLLIKNLFLECLSQQGVLDKIIADYEPFIDFYSFDCELCYFYYLAEKDLAACTKAIKEYLQQYEKNIDCYMLYVFHTLVLIFRGFDSSYQALDNSFHILASRWQGEYKRESYPNMAELLQVLIAKLIRYEIVHFLTDEKDILIYNHNALTINISSFVEQLIQTPIAEHEIIFAELNSILTTVQDIDLLKALLSNMILRLYSELNIAANSVELNQFTEQINQCRTTKELQPVIKDKINVLFMYAIEAKEHHKDFIEKLIQYVHEHLSDPTLSLKQVSANYLYMNPDYVGKQFLKQTGFKFSAYLVNARMEKAKKLLLENDSEKIYMIAEQVGCENNPQYFSQLFKKYTKMTPTAYAKKYKQNRQSAEF